MSTQTITASTSSGNDPNHHADSSGAAQGNLLATAGSRTTNDIVEFNDAGPVLTAEYSRVNNLDALLRDLKPSTEAPHSITDFLSRPQLLDTIQLKQTDVEGTIVYEFDVMKTLYEHPTLRVFRQKLDGFYGFSAKAVCKVNLNAQPKLQGIYAISFAPLFNAGVNDVYLPITITTSWPKQRLPFLTGLPTKRLNLSQGQSFSLGVDYVAPDVYMNLGESARNHPADFGRFMLYAISPLRGATTGEMVNASIYLSFEDVKLFGASHPTFQTQSGLTDEQAEASPNPTPESKPWYANFTPSNILSLASQIPGLDLLPGGSLIPGALRLGSNIAKIAGYSKPTTTPNFERVAITPFGQPQNVDGASNAFKLGASADNMLELSNFGVTETDEMNLLNIVRVPTYLDNMSWPKTAVPRTLLAEFLVEPNCRLFWTPNAPTSSFYPSLMYFVSSHFLYWRGAIKFHLDFASTKFHTGRIRVCYALDTAPGALTAGNIPYVYSQIFDLRDGTSVVFECPYFSTTPWRMVPTQKHPTLGHFVPVYRRNTLEAANRLQIYVEDSLSASDGVADAIQIAVSVSAGDDYELAGPTIPDQGIENSYQVAPSSSYSKATLPLELTNKSKSKKKKMMSLPIESQYGLPLPTPRSAIPPQSVYPSLEHTKTNSFFTQSGLGVGDQTDVPTINMITGTVPKTKPAVRPMVVTMGEAVTSLRQLIKRYQTVGIGVALTNSTNVIAPFIYPASGPVSGYSKTFLHRFQPLFRFYRGGMRFIVLTDDAANPVTSVAFLSQMLQSSSWDSLPFGDDYGNSCPMAVALDPTTGNPPQPFNWVDFMAKHATASSFPVINSIQGGVEIQFPFYSQLPFLALQPQDKATNIQSYLDGMFQGIFPAGIAIFENQKQSRLTLYQATSDDYSMSYRIGAPICRSHISFEPPIEP